ncbi:xanthine dehydrogenase family protein molybdopterin-binding subunit [Methylobacterium planeticum]|uniref:Xanthine dehydrogenase family protein n=1 Tax=Methylobacterium planeticum TaxID=2615211 RepID=A0A6N6MKL3_9HYPH|nr:xanthine dehydrogenase family protein [Methylobacterium planeticum]KAB1070202.1 xanthine dehydrogenase family protein [Methylobacterium planeticum]
MTGRCTDPPRRSFLAGSAALLLSGRGLAPAAASPAEPPFGTDLRLPGLARAVVARPPLRGWRLARLDPDATRAFPGVLAVLPLAPLGHDGPTSLGGVAVVARDTWSAHRGLDALRLGWEPPEAQPGIRPGPSHRPRAPQSALSDPPGTPAEVPSATALSTAGRATVWACLEHPQSARTAIAALTGVDDIALCPVRLGGGSSRFVAPAYAVEALRIARALPGRPVTLLWTRADDIPFRYRSEAGVGGLGAWDTSARNGTIPNRIHAA